MNLKMNEWLAAAAVVQKLKVDVVLLMLRMCFAEDNEEEHVFNYKTF